ncbi:MAG: hypothetical protein ACRDTD_27580 [Pseudonocardiaceae bacterium]
MLLFSFLPFVSYSESIRGPIDRSGYDTWFNAWETQTFMAPLTWFAVLAAAAAAAASVGSYIFAGKLRLLTFSTAQLQLLFSLFAAFVLFGYAMSSKSVIFGSDYAEYLGDKTFAKGIEFSAGGYLMLIFALLAVIGAFMNLYRVGPTLFPRSRPSATDVSA